MVTIPVPVIRLAPPPPRTVDKVALKLEEDEAVREVRRALNEWFYANAEVPS